MKLLSVKQIFTWSCFLAAVFLSGTNPLMAQQSSQVSDSPGVQGVASAFVGAWNAHDMDALANLFAADADFVNVVGMWWRDRETIRKAHVQVHQTIFKTSTVAMDSISVKFLSSDIAVAHMTWTLSGHLTPDGKPGSPRHGILSFVMKREGKDWLIQSAQNTDIIPGVATIPQGQPQPGK
ncbi:MAG TPA: SgcJ/EcaC family oxidoreductase [Candidatus Deferrimicrobium sp.]|nr:SgcJ/EcaC family oxidoreductase [Candidatus Deferrimicrobium sp.]